MTLQDVHRRLAGHIAARVRGGELTERGLARRAGISQPHLHNVLKGKRYFSLQSADRVLLELGLSIDDLLAAGIERSAGEAGRTRSCRAESLPG